MMFDQAAIINHVGYLHAAAKRTNIEGGKVVLAVYGEDPDTQEKFASVEHFSIGDVESMAAAAMEFDGIPHRNVYAPLCVLRPDVTPGTRKEDDIAAVFGFVIDGDADKGKAVPTSPLPPDYIVESSEGNLQSFLFLDQPLSRVDAKGYAQALKRATAADSADDIGHVWRVPGCLNWPNATKVHDPKGKRGRKRARDPQPVLVRKKWDKWTSVSDLRTVLEPYWEISRSMPAETATTAVNLKFDLARVSRWIDRKLAGNWDLSQGDWALLGKAIKLSFNDADGLRLWLRLSHDKDKAEARWNDPNDFKAEHVDGMRTLHHYLDNDVDWTWGDVVTVIGSEAPPIVPAVPLPDLIQSSADFVGGFVPPEYLIDGVLQRRYFYSLTAQTGVGKTAIAMRWTGHVVSGTSLGGLDVEQGTVLYFAGENPTDVQARWLGLTREMRIDPATADVHFLVGAMDLSQVAARISAEVAAKGLHLALVIVDTAAAYNFGDDENSNTQAGGYARQLRSLTELPGGPCVVVLCHPTKRAAEDDLSPRGGGAFLAEVDGNMAVQKKDSLLAVSPQGKFRGDQSWALRYELDVIRDHPVLKDVRGRFIPTVVAKPVGEGAAVMMEKRTDRDAETVLKAVCDAPGGNAADLARTLGWVYGKASTPNHVKVGRILKQLAKDKMVVERMGRWRTTPAGDKELNAIDLARVVAPVMPLPPFPLAY